MYALGALSCLSCNKNMIITAVYDSLQMRLQQVDHQNNEDFYMFITTLSHLLHSILPSECQCSRCPSFVSKACAHGAGDVLKASHTCVCKPPLNGSSVHRCIRSQDWSDICVAWLIRTLLLFSTSFAIMPCPCMFFSI